MYVNIDELALEYTRAGIEVDILPGAHTRAARMFVASGYVRGPQGLDRHHTAQHETMDEKASIMYMTFWAKYPVMTNTYPWKNGRLTICAAGPTYSAGSGGPLGDVSSGNAEFWSMEIGNNGIGEPYSEAQQETILRATAVEVEYFSSRHNWDTMFTKPRIPAHFEWAPGRKIDPSGPSRWNNYQNTKWDMDHFRRDVEAMHQKLYSGVPMPPYGQKSSFYPIKPVRTSDTRVFPKAPIAGNRPHRFGIGSDVIPADAIGVLLNVVAVNPERPGFISITAPGEMDEGPGISLINFVDSGVIANTTYTTVIDRQYDIWSSCPTHVVVDVLGYYKKD